MKASQALFDQTKIRTDEVINNAERNRSRLTTVITAIGSLITIITVTFGARGLDRLNSIIDRENQIKNIENEVREKSTKVDESLKIAERISTIPRDIDDFKNTMDTTINSLIQYYLFPQYIKAMDSQDIKKVLEHLEALVQLKTNLVLEIYLC